MATAIIKSTRNGDSSTTQNSGSREDLVLNDVLNLESNGTGATTYSWAIVFKPMGSSPVLSTPTNATTDLSGIDKEGAYLIRLTVNPGDATEDSQFVRFRLKTVFGKLDLVAAGERKDDTATIPFDIDAYGWAYAQNSNLRTLLEFVKPVVSSGRVFFVDGGGSSGSAKESCADYSTIQAAIDAADNTSPTIDTPYVILIRAGLYTEDLVLKPHIHLVGFNGQHPQTPDAKNAQPPDDRIVVIRSSTTAGITTSSANLGDIISLTNLHIENTLPNTSNSLLTKSGEGLLKIVNCVINDTIASIGQKPTVELAKGRLIVQNSKITMNDGGDNGNFAVTQTGESTSMVFENSKVYGPSCVQINGGTAPHNVAGVLALFRGCEIISSGTASSFGVANNGTLTLDHTTIETNLGKHLAINWLGSTLGTVNSGDCIVTLLWSALVPNNTPAQLIEWNIDNAPNTNKLQVGASWYEAVTTVDTLGNGTAVLYDALIRGESINYDNASSGMSATDVQAAIDEIHGITSTAVQNATNIGVQAGGGTVFWQKNGTTLEFKSLIPSASGLALSLTNNNTQVIFEISEPERIVADDTAVTVVDDGVTAGVINFKTEGTDVWQIDANGHLIPQVSGSLDIGSATNRVRSIYVDAVQSVHFIHDNGTYDWPLNVDVSDPLIPVLKFNNQAIGGGLTNWSENGSGDLLPDTLTQDLGSVAKPVAEIFADNGNWNTLAGGVSLIEGGTTLKVLNLSATTPGGNAGFVYHNTEVSNSADLTAGANLTHSYQLKGQNDQYALFRFYSELKKPSGSTVGSSLKFQLLDNSGSNAVSTVFELDSNDASGTAFRSVNMTNSLLTLMTNDPATAPVDDWVTAGLVPTGAVIYNSNSNKVAFYNGSAWNDLDSASFTNWQETSGHFVPTQDAQFDIGMTTKRVRDLYLSESSLKMLDGGTPQATTLALSGAYAAGQTTIDLLAQGKADGTAIVASDYVDWRFRMTDGITDSTAFKFRTKRDPAYNLASNVGLWLNNISGNRAEVMNWTITGTPAEFITCTLSGRFDVTGKIVVSGGVDIGAASKLQLGTITTATIPASGLSAGEVLFNTDTNKVIVYNGTDWKALDENAVLTVNSVSPSAGNVTLNFEDLADVPANPSTNQVLEWNGSAFVWINTPSGGGGSVTGWATNANNDFYPTATTRSLGAISTGENPVNLLYLRGGQTSGIRIMDTTTTNQTVLSLSSTLSSTTVTNRINSKVSTSPLTNSDSSIWKYSVEDDTSVYDQLQIEVGKQTSAATLTREAIFSTFNNIGAASEAFKITGHATGAGNIPILSLSSVFRLHSATSPPLTGGAAGDMYFDSTNNGFKFHDGTAWISLQALSVASNAAVAGQGSTLSYNDATGVFSFTPNDPERIGSGTDARVEVSATEVEITTGNTSRWKVDANGHLLPQSILDIGSATNRIGTLFGNSAKLITAAMGTVYGELSSSGSGGLTGRLLWEFNSVIETVGYHSDSISDFIFGGDLVPNAAKTHSIGQWNAGANNSRGLKELWSEDIIGFIDGPSANRTLQLGTQWAGGVADPVDIVMLTENNQGNLAVGAGANLKFMIEDQGGTSADLSKISSVLTEHTPALSSKMEMFVLQNGAEEQFLRLFSSSTAGQRVTALRPLQLASYNSSSPPPANQTFGDMYFDNGENDVKLAVSVGGNPTYVNLGIKKVSGAHSFQPIGKGKLVAGSGTLTSTPQDWGPFYPNFESLSAGNTALGVANTMTSLTALTNSQWNNPTTNDQGISLCYVIPSGVDTSTGVSTIHRTILREGNYAGGTSAFIMYFKVDYSVNSEFDNQNARLVLDFKLLASGTGGGFLSRTYTIDLSNGTSWAGGALQNQQWMKIDLTKNTMENVSGNVQAGVTVGAASPNPNSVDEWFPATEGRPAGTFLDIRYLGVGGNGTTVLDIITTQPMLFSESQIDNK